MNYSVYRHTFPNGKVYIGITKQNPVKRWNNGNGYLGKVNEKYKQPKIANAIVKYGWENIKHEILHYGLSKEEAEEKEIELIAIYKSNNKEFGYNIANGGSTSGAMAQESKYKISNANRGRVLSAEHKAKLSSAHYGKPLSENHRKKIGESNKGHIVSEETRKKLSSSKKGVFNPQYGKHPSKETLEKLKKSHMGKKLSEETRKKISESNKNRKISEKQKEKLRQINIGKKLSEETKGKISESLKGHKVSEETKRKIKEASSKPVKCIETEIVYSSIAEAARENNICPSHIGSCCNGKRKTTGGYHWSFIDKEAC